MSSHAVPARTWARSSSAASLTHSRSGTRALGAVWAQVGREAVNTAHRQVRSTASSPVKYNAMDRGLQLWVAMCLYIGYEDTHQLLRGRMNREQRALFYRDAAPLGTTRRPSTSVSVAEVPRPRRLIALPCVELPP